MNLPRREMVSEPIAKYSPDQPRVSSGNPDGGQWTSGNDGSDSGTQVSQVFPFLEEPPVMIRPPFEQLPEDPTVPPGPGYIWKGKGDPGGPEGGWKNDETGESLHPDMNNEKHGPHWDYTRFGRKYRWYPDGTLVPKTIVGPIVG